MLYKTGYTQMFMETPFRNSQMIQAAFKTLKNHTLFSIAADIFGEFQFIKTQPIEKWKEEEINLHKIPAVFGIGQYP